MHSFGPIAAGMPPSWGCWALSTTPNSKLPKHSPLCCINAKLSCVFILVGMFDPRCISHFIGIVIAASCGWVSGMPVSFDVSRQQGQKPRQCNTESHIDDNVFDACVVLNCTCQETWPFPPTTITTSTPICCCFCPQSNEQKFVKYFVRFANFWDIRLVNNHVWACYLTGPSI